jgi:hypothetical protein
MITIKNITMKNFLSVGNVTQAVKLNNSGLTLVLGENLDLGGGDQRNGVGKCICINTMVDIRDKKTGKISKIAIGDLYEKFKK